MKTTDLIVVSLLVAAALAFIAYILITGAQSRRRNRQREQRRVRERTARADVVLIRTGSLRDSRTPSVGVSSAGSTTSDLNDPLNPLSPLWIGHLSSDTPAAPERHSAPIHHAQDQQHQTSPHSSFSHDSGSFHSHHHDSSSSNSYDSGSSSYDSGSFSSSDSGSSSGGGDSW